MYISGAISFMCGMNILGQDFYVWDEYFDWMGFVKNLYGKSIFLVEKRYRPFLVEKGFLAP